MIEQDITICNKLGLHARAAAKFVTLASTFLCHVTVRRDKRTVNGKSIMGVMMLAASKGTTLQLQADGPDEQEAVMQLVALVNNKFEESE